MFQNLLENKYTRCKAYLIKYHTIIDSKMIWPNQLEIAIMKKTIWISEIILVVLLPKVLCKTYDNNIQVDTAPDTRQFVAKTDKDTGGWIVRVLNKGGYFVCGGSYIAPLAVVTSADCMMPFHGNIEGFIVESSKMLLSEDNFSPVIGLYIPPEFKKGKTLMDVAVLRLLHPIKGKKTQFIKLCSTTITANMKMTSFGWGYGAANIKAISLDTLSTTASTIDLKQCESSGNKEAISNTVFCVHYGTQDPSHCLYDPGSPLVHDSQLCGIVSHAFSCNKPQLPAIYTDVNKVKHFIEHTIAEIKKK